MSAPRARTVLFAGGGTGGHIFPGLAIAERLRERDPDFRCVFLCSDRPLDAQILSAAGESFIPLPARPIGDLAKRPAHFLQGWRAATQTTRNLIAEARRETRRIDLLAMGGFVAVAPAMAAKRRGVGVTLVNLDATPGKANRLIARVASRACTAAEGDAPLSWTRIGPIVRTAALPKHDAAQSRANLALLSALPTLFISGGSQGAKSINDAMIELLERAPTLLHKWQVFHQCGEGAAERLTSAYESAGVRARVVAFCDTMGDAWGAADLAICRAGAGTVAEVRATSTPAVFLPYPYHRDEHQRKNAEPLERAGGAMVVRDAIDPHQNADTLLPLLSQLLVDEARRLSMRSALREMGPADGAATIADALLSP